MRSARPTAARLAAYLGVPLALVASAVVISNASYSAFSATTGNPTSNWSSGSVQLSDDDNGVALFSATGLKPGLTGNNCIKVTSTGTLPAAIKLYATGPAAPNALATAMTLTIEQGTGGGYGTCTGFTADSTLYSGSLAGFALPTSSYSSGINAWTTSGSAAESRVFRFSYTLPTTAPSNAQGLTTSATITWEAQNT